MSAEEFNLDNLKKQYKKLAKACHPDLNPDDKEAEEKFKRLTAAYKKLLENSPDRGRKADSIKSRLFI